MKRAKKVAVALEDPFLIIRNGNPRQLQAYLEERGINANKARTCTGWTLLHRAAEQGQIELCEVLIHFGAKIDERSAQGWYTPLHLALGNGWIDTALYLLDCGANPAIKNKYGQDPVTFADKKGYPDIVKRFRQAVKTKMRESKLQGQFLLGSRGRESFSFPAEDEDDDEEEVD